jgi:hypothetical protein
MPQVTGRTKRPRYAGPAAMRIKPFLSAIYWVKTHNICIISNIVGSLGTLVDSKGVLGFDRILFHRGSTWLVGFVFGKVEDMTIALSARGSPGYGFTQTVQHFPLILV